MIVRLQPSGPPGRLAAMTIVYGGDRWYLDDDEVRVQPPGQEPRPVAPEDVPLPVARVLRSLRLDQAA
jgi:hypothetical protein